LKMLSGTLLRNFSSSASVSRNSRIYHLPTNSHRDCVSGIRSYTTEKKVPVELIKELRKRTSAGISDCKSALEENNNDVEAAISWLKKKGVAKASSKLSRSTMEGVVGFDINDQGTRGAIVEVNSETDFVAKGASFLNLSGDIISSLLHLPSNTQDVQIQVPLELVKEAKLGDGRTVNQGILETVAKLGENIQPRRAHVLEVQPGKGLVCGYIHQAVEHDTGSRKLGKVAALVALESSNFDQAKLKTVGDRLAMHIAGFAPAFINKQDIPAEVMAKHKKEADDANQPFDQNSVEQELALMEQEFTFGANPQQIRDMLGDTKVVAFLRYKTGEAQSP